MVKIKILIITVSLFIFFSCAERSNSELVSKAGAPLLKGLGNHSHVISSDIHGVQKYFDQGMIMAFAFNHAESIRSFKAAQKLDPNCAMCYWGEALALGPNINVNSDGKVIMAPQNRVAAFEAINKAMDLSDNASNKEKAYISALSSRYNGNPKTNREALDIAYANAMEDLSRAYPNDNDAASLFAEALMNTMPWNYWAEDGDPKPDTVKVLHSLESVLASNPNHPLAIHLYIHAVEASSDPARAEKPADRLAKLVPGAGHLVHMPAHIYWRVGRYHDASLANIEAAKVDEDYIAQCNAQGFYPALYYPHNVHFLWAASTMEGRSRLSIESALKVSKYVRTEQIKQLPFLEFFHTIPLLSYIRFAKWDEILSYDKPIEEFKFSLGLYHYARSVAFASTGDLISAKSEQQQILPLKDAPEIKVIIKAGQPSDKLLEIANHLAMGQIELSKMNLEASIMHFKMAVAVQDALPYREPEFWYYPTRQTLGHALLLNNDFEEAINVFKKDLVNYPRNGWSYFGLHKAYKSIGKSKLANDALLKHQAIWQMSDVELQSSVIY
jgi:tetratricopeptide (TPR) repeat protein